MPASLRTALERFGTQPSLAVALLLTAVVVGSVLAVGTVHVSVLLVVAPLALFTGVMALYQQRPRLRDLPAPVFVLVFLALWSAVQSVPLPSSWLVRISPNSARVWANALEPLGESAPAWTPISLDPGASLVEALKWLSYAAVFLAAAFVGHARGRRTGVAIVFGAAAVAALVTIVHGLSGATTLYGFYQLSIPKPQWKMSPLVASNSFAGYLNLGVFAGFGLLAARRTWVPRWLLGLGVATILATSFITASRAGWASLFVGIPLLAVSLWRVERRQSERSQGRSLVWLEVGGVALFGLGLFLLGATEKVWKELLDDSLQKVALIDWTRSLIAAHFWVGVGRGGFETAFPAYRGGTGHYVYQHAENFVAQWCAEWGVPVAALAILALFFVFRPRRLGANRDPVATSALVWVVVLLLQNMMDLALEIASVSLALFSLLGSLWGAERAHEEQRRSDGTVPKCPRVPAFSLALLGVAATLGAGVAGMRPARQDRDRLRKLLPTGEGKASLAHVNFRNELAQAIRRHPGDPYLPLLGALSARRVKQNPLPWIGRAIERDPNDGRPYLLLALVLADRGAKQQALPMLRKAVEFDVDLTRVATSVATRLSSDPKELAQVAPSGTAGARVLLSLAGNLGKPDQQVARWDLTAMAIAQAPLLVDARLAAADNLIGELAQRDKSARCGLGRQETCGRQLEEQAAAIARITPDSDRPAILRARGWFVRGHPDKADRILEEACNRPGASADCWTWRVHVLGALPPSRKRAEVERTYLTMACTTAQACAVAASWLAGMAAGRGDWFGATEFYERAARESADPAAWLQVARAAVNVGLYSRATRAIQHAKGGGISIPGDLEQTVTKAREERMLESPKGSRRR